MEIEEEEVEEVNLVRTADDAAAWLMEMTGCEMGLAVAALQQAGGDISDALDVLPTLQQVG